MEDYLKSVAPSIKPVTYTHKDVNGVEQTINETMLILPAIVKAIPDDSEIKTLNNAKKTKWRLITVTILNPVTNKEEDVNAQLFETSLQKFGNHFSVDGQVELAVQTQGKFKGYAKAQLKSTSRIDADAFVAFINANKSTPAQQVGQTA
jgi:RNase P/RNase MRP subunit POP5